MRIDAYNQVAQLYGAQTTYNNTHKNNRAASMGNDQLSISQTGYNYQVAKAVVAEAADVRMDRVAEIKARMKNGTYSVNTEDLANKILEKCNAFM